MIDWDISQFERHLDFKKMATWDPNLIQKDREELLEIIAELRSQMDLASWEIKYLKVSHIKKTKHNSTLETTDLAIKALSEPERLKEQIHHLKQRMLSEKEEKKELQIALNRLRKYLQSLKKSANPHAQLERPSVKISSEKQTKIISSLRLKLRKKEEESLELQN